MHELQTCTSFEKTIIALDIPGWHDSWAKWLIGEIL
jgi:hypothetical protein